MEFEFESSHVEITDGRRRWSEEDFRSAVSDPSERGDASVWASVLAARNPNPLGLPPFVVRRHPRASLDSDQE